MKTEMGYQLSSITPYLDTPAHMRDSFEKIAKIGYRHVQLQGVPIEIDDNDIANALKGSGLNCVATQVDYSFALGNNSERVIARASRCGAKCICFALIPREIDSIAALEEFAVKVNKTAKKVQAAGMILTFHPIGHDFRDMQGQPAYQRLLDLLTESIQLTFCVSSAHSAGIANTLPIIEKYAGRIDLVHFKDDAPISGTERHLMPLGQGTHDWAPILNACNDAGVKYVFAEQERWLKDAFDCAKDSYDYLKSLGL